MFVAREALPLLTSGEIHKEVTLGKMWMAQQWPGYDQAEHIWQPVSEIPKYGVWPLIVGTAKVTLVAMFFGVPLGVGAALYVSQYASTRVARDREARGGAAGGHPFSGARVSSGSW